MSGTPVLGKVHVFKASLGYSAHSRFVSRNKMHKNPKQQKSKTKQQKPSRIIKRQITQFKNVQTR